MLQYFDTLTDISGNALVGATVLVKNYIGGANANIYLDNGLTPIGTSTVTSGVDNRVPGGWSYVDVTAAIEAGYPGVTVVVQ
jgi:hypothetical protein